ncbi:MAG: YDG domain-containing protein, partial [Tannerella sp.]|nr:YDG domain-containing protein [Tannerella sp.]
DGNGLTLDKSGATGNFGSVNVQNGTVDFIGFALDGPAKGNYTLTQPTDVPASIIRQEINITGGMATKIYDGTTAAEVSSLTFDVALANSQLEIGNDYTVANATYANAGVGTGITVTANVTLKSPSKADNYVLLNGAGYGLTTGVITPNTPPVAALAFTLGDPTYDGSAHPVTVTVDPGVTGLGDILAIKYTGTAGTDYPVSTTAPVKAGAYTVTVDIDAGTNYAAITGLVIGSFTIGKAEPTPAVLAFTLGDVACTGSPRPVPVTPAKDVEGLGAITVYYNGSTTAPVDPGEYAVTIDIAEGANYAAVTGLPLGAFTIQEPPIPVPTHFRVLLPSVAGLTTDPPAGAYRVNGGANFTFTLTPDVPSADGTPPQVQTNRPTPGRPNASGIRITPNADGSYTVVIIGIRQDIEIDLAVADSKSGPTDNASVADAGALKVYTAPGALVIANSRPGAATVYVYNLAGTLVRLTTVQPGTTRLAVPKGVYAVSDGGVFRQKVAVFR